MSTTRENQTTAVIDCKRFGAELATVNNQVEDEFVYSLMKESTYIGLENIAQTELIGVTLPAGTWAWQNPSAMVSYTNWAPSEPNGSGFCVVKIVSKSGVWEDWPCYKKRITYAAWRQRNLVTQAGYWKI